MSHIQQITLDLIPNGEMPILYASQYDAGRSFRANIVERKIPYTLDGTELISLTVRKGDGNLVTMDIANTFANKSYIDFLSTEQMTAVSGSNFGELHLESNGVSIGTLNFYLLVEPAADEGGITSESEINNLRRQVNEMVDEEMGDYLLKTEAEETYATITALETLSGVVDTKASQSDLETLAGVVDTKASKTYVDNVVSPKADKTYVDTQLQTKANASDVYTKTETDNKISALIDDTQALENKAWSSKKTYDEIVNVLPTGNASGSIANFNTSLALPLVSAKFDVNATQEAGTPTPQSPKAISGVSAVNVVKCGVNLWDEVWEIGGIDNLTGQNIASINSYRSKNYIQVPKGENLYLVNGNSDTLGLRYYDNNKVYIGSRAFLGSKILTYGTNDLPTGTAYIRFVNVSTTSYLNNISINYPSIDTDYHAYNGSTTLINLGGTYYGGYVSQDKNGKREITVTHGYKKDLSNLIWRLYHNCFYASVSDMKKAHAKVLCNEYEWSISSSFDNIPNMCIGTQSGDNVILIKDNSFEDVTAFTNSLTNTEIIYELEEPFTVELPDGEPIVTLVGTNNIYADSGDCEVTYKKSIDDAIAELQALILS